MIDDFKLKRQTLCWNCKRLDCSWMKDLKPVKGWTAEKSSISSFTSRKKREIKSYFVIDCPLFEASDKSAED